MLIATFCCGIWSVISYQTVIFFNFILIDFAVFVSELSWQFVLFILRQKRGAFHSFSTFYINVLFYASKKQTHSMEALIKQTMQMKYHFSLILNLMRWSLTLECGLKKKGFSTTLVSSRSLNFQARKCNLMWGQQLLLQPPTHAQTHTYALSQQLHSSVIFFISTFLTYLEAAVPGGSSDF